MSKVEVWQITSFFFYILTDQLFFQDFSKLENGQFFPYSAGALLQSRRFRSTAAVCCKQADNIAEMETLFFFVFSLLAVQKPHIACLQTSGQLLEIARVKSSWQARLRVTTCTRPHSYSPSLLSKWQAWSRCLLRRGDCTRSPFAFLSTPPTKSSRSAFLISSWP